MPNKHPIHEDLLSEIEAYRQAHKLTKTGIGMLLLRDPNLVTNLEDGRELRRSTEAKIRAKLAVPAPASEPVPAGLQQGGA